MKFITLLALLTASFSAQAADPIVPYLMSYTKNHTDVPRAGWNKTCTIDSDSVDQVMKGGYASVRPTSKKVKWTKEVPNAARLEALLLQAAEGEIAYAKCLQPPGPRTEFTGVVKSVKDSKVVTVKLGTTPCKYVNMSPAASVLIKFIKARCK